MVEAGHLAILMALASSLWAVGAGLWSFMRSDAGAGRSAERGIVAAFAMTTAAVYCLLYLLRVRDFQVAYVWSYTSRTLPEVYALTALWAGQEGSLLFWAWILLLCGAGAVRTNRDRNREVMPVVAAVIGVTAAFFLYLTAAPADPFAYLWEKFPDAPVGVRPADGQGLNPLLQNPGMVVHPPLLYLGYVGLAIPFAFAIGALATGRIGAEWIRTTRLWAVGAWTFLGLGILAGAKWAYHELGWGGYWGWDPVENASLMPWLTATAYIHSVMIEERRGMLRIWNVSLIAITFLLSIFGTFLTRSGLISSVHAFAQSDVGRLFAFFLVAWGVVATGLIWWRRAALASDHRIESLLSREATFLFNNLILLGMAFAVLWGTVFPMISEWATGERAGVGPPYFNRVIFPLAILLYVLTGIGPLIAWRRADGATLRRILLPPAAAGLAGAAAAFALGIRMPAPLAGIWAAGFVVAASVLDFAAGARARAANSGEGLPLAAWRVMRRNGRRYGGYLVHVGMALVFFGIMGSYYNVEVERFLLPGESLEVEGYSVRLDRIRDGDDGHRRWVGADLSIERGGREIGRLAPELSLFAAGTEREQTASEVDIRSRPAEDLYLVLGGVAEDDAGRLGATIRAVVNPLVFWVWAGAGLSLVGALFAIVPPPRRRMAEAPAPEVSAGSPARAAAATTALLAALLLVPGAADAAPPPNLPPILHDEYGDVAAEVMCLCGCGMTLASCSHDVCSGRDTLNARIGPLLMAGRSRDEVLAVLEAEYGKRVLGAPRARGFDVSAWVLPFAAVVIGGGAIGLALRRWRRMPPPEAPAVVAGALSADDRAEVDRALEELR